MAAEGRKQRQGQGQEVAKCRQQQPHGPDKGSAGKLPSGSGGDRLREGAGGERPPRAPRTGRPESGGARGGFPPRRLKQGRNDPEGSERAGSDA